MSHFVLMPQLGVSEESGIVAAWYVKPGDAVKVGDRLFSLETGKTSFDVESEFEGTVLTLLCGEGDEVLIKTPVCAIGQPGESPLVTAVAATAAVATDTAAVPVAAPRDLPAQAHAAAPVTAQTGADGTGVSPRARALAQKAGVPAQSASPTGPEGRVIERDIRTLIASGVTQPAAFEPATTQAVTTAHAAPPTAAFEDKPLSGIRKLIAKNMHASLSNMAQLTHNASFDATALLQYRALCKQTPEASRITLTDMILFTVAKTLPEFPMLNAWFMDDKMRYFNGVNLACAVDTERGLMVPVLFGADRMTLAELSGAMKTLAADCYSGQIASHLLEGGSFTVSNLGAYGIESFTPIINPPQTGILGVCAAVPRVRETNGVLSVYPAMTLSLTYDHRALDGAPASRFLAAMCKNLEQFPLTLAF